MSADALPITYVAARWGEPTETFVRREADAVAGLGVTVRRRSMGRPVAGGDAREVDHLPPSRAAVQASRTILRHPTRSARVLATVIRRSARRNVVRQLWAATTGLAWAAGLRDRHSHLHAHFGWVAATATWACSRITGQTCSVVLHSFEVHARPYLDGFAGVPLRAADAVFAVSGFDADVVAERWRVPAQVLPMGVPGAWLEAAPTSDPEPGLVVSIGSLRPYKGHDVLLRALALTRHPWRLVVAGEGPERARLVALAAELGLEGRVRFVGLLDERSVRALLDRAWVSALASVVAPDGERDGVPVALMEAMARGVPVVASDLGGIPELVAGAGELVPPGDPRAVAAAIDRFADAGTRARVGEQGRQRVADGWTAAASARLLLGAVQRTAEEASRPQGSAAP